MPEFNQETWLLEEVARKLKTGEPVRLTDTVGQTVLRWDAARRDAPCQCGHSESSHTDHGDWELLEHCHGDGCACFGYTVAHTQRV